MTCNRKLGPFDCCSVVQGDCLDLMKQLPDGCVDAVITDPPYAIPTVVASCRETTRNIGDLSLIESTFRMVFADIERVTATDGRMFVFCDGVSYHVVFRAAYGHWSTALLVWDKERIGMGREFRKQHELIMHCWNSATPIFADGVGRADVLRFTPVGDDKLHPAQKPVELLEELLRVSGETILDPFCGSGTTLVAAAKLGRHYLGFEISEDYCRIARERIARVEAQPTLFEAKPEQALFCQTCGETLADEQLLAIHMAAQHELRVEPEGRQ